MCDIICVNITERQIIDMTSALLLKNSYILCVPKEVTWVWVLIFPLVTP